MAMSMDLGLFFDVVSGDGLNWVVNGDESAAPLWPIYIVTVKRKQSVQQDCRKRKRKESFRAHVNHSSAANPYSKSQRFDSCDYTYVIKVLELWDCAGYFYNFFCFYFFIFSFFINS